jgi:hypothetical protein
VRNTLDAIVIRGSRISARRRAGNGRSAYDVAAMQGGRRVLPVEEQRVARRTDRHLITITESLWVNRPPEAVFDYTADFATRTEWDRSISEVTILGTSPRAARVTVPGLGRTSVVVRLDRRPERTSAVFQDVDSRWITGGGGAWQYAPEEGGTHWTVTNSVEFKPSWVIRLLGPVIARNIRGKTRRAMAEAKRILES